MDSLPLEDDEVFGGLDNLGLLDGCGRAVLTWLIAAIFLELGLFTRRLGSAMAAFAAATERKPYILSAE